MLLVTRTLLIILFTINTAGSADVNLLIVLVVSFSLAVANSNGVYRNWAYNYLESFFYLQLGVFAGVPALCQAQPWECHHCCRYFHRDNSSHYLCCGGVPYYASHNVPQKILLQL